MANKQVFSGHIFGPGPNGEVIGGFDDAGNKTVKPLNFLGGTVLSFNCSLGIGPLEESSLSLEIINDCKVSGTDDDPKGEYFLGNVSIGSPCFLDLGEALSPYGTKFEHDMYASIDRYKPFKFGGILQSYTANQSSGGLTFSARVVDPRALLGGVVIIVGNTLAGPIKHRNYYNAYSYFEYNVLSPADRYPQPATPFNLPDTVEKDEVPVPVKSGAIDQTVNPKSDCSLFGEANVNENGMLYYKILEALRNMDLMAYSANYGEEHYPALNQKDSDYVAAKKTNKHENNVFRIDLSELPEPPDVPLYYRIPGPSITLLDLINNVCESTGKIFHVELIESSEPGTKLHTIKIRTADIKDLNNQDFKREIIQYNGRATDISYGKELSSNNNRSIMIGEQKHQMYETSKLLPFFGEDKYGNPIVPTIPSGTGVEESCGWKMMIPIEDLQYSLRCPLYDYNEPGVSGSTRSMEVVARKVEINEYHMRVAASSFEVWKKYVFNTFNIEDFASIIRRNFPDQTQEFLDNINSAMITLARNSGVAPSGNDPPAISGTGNNPPEFVEEASSRSVADRLAGWNSRMLDGLRIKREANLERVYDWISSMARTYYGKQYLALVSSNLCVADKAYVDLEYINFSGTQVNAETTIYNDPCGSGTEGKTVLSNKVWRPKTYTHVPTNEGAWIEPCGSVLGLGPYLAPNQEVSPGRTIGSAYLDFFRTDDGRVQPLARFDSKLIATLNRVENVIDERPIAITGVDGINAASVMLGIFDTGISYEDLTSPENLMFASGICGDLDVSSWSKDSYVKYSISGQCPPPATGSDPIEALDLPSTVWAKCSVADKFYHASGCIVSGEEIIYTKTLKSGEIDGLENGYECCGAFQWYNPYAPCYEIFNPFAKYPEGEDCYEYQRSVVPLSGCAASGDMGIPIIFDSPAFTRYCDEASELEMVAAETEQLLIGIGLTGLEPDDARANPISYDPYSGNLRRKGNTIIPTTPRFCFKPNPTGISLIASSLDFQSTKNQSITSTAFIPTAVAIPVKSNLETYGPWKSQNFETSAGGIELIQDQDFSPWTFNSYAAMDKFAKELINDRQFNKSEIETGSVTIPGFPEKPLGFIKNGPNLTNINVSMGSNGVTTTYSYKTYTPKFGGMKALEKKAMKDNLTLVNNIRKQAREKQRNIDSINRKIGGTKGTYQPEKNPKLSSVGTMQRIIAGEIYPFSLLTEASGAVDSSGAPDPSGTGTWGIIGTGDRVVVGTETLQKSVMDLRYDYRRKAFMSLDGLFSPVTNSRPSGTAQDGVDPKTGLPSGVSSSLPVYAHYEHPDTKPDSKKKTNSIFDSPIPPVRVSGEDADVDVHNCQINRKFLDPLQNNFGSGEHPHHKGAGAGHQIDIVGRGTEPPDSGVIMNFYGQGRWDDRYSDEYRFLGLRGPLVLHQWGFDTQGKPIPNLIDDPELIAQSGIFRTSRPSGEIDNSSGVYMSGIGSGLSDYFMRDWLHKPSSWPVGPVDLRFDRKRGVWVSPPDYKIVVVEPTENITPYNSGEGILINQREKKLYGDNIYSPSGTLVEASGSSSKARITIEDRLGVTSSKGKKSYAYYDSFTSSYLLMSGGSTIRIGKFCNQWPSLSNVKDPANAVKNVVCYEAEPCPDNEPDCFGFNMVPTMTKVSGIDIPETVEVMNLFSNVSAHEYQTKWCAFTSIGDKYFLISAEC